MSRARIVVVQHEGDAGLGRLAAPLREDAELDVRRPDRGQPLPADLDGVDALVVLGGAMAAWEDEAAPWLPQTRRLLALGAETDLPTLGICLGAQLLALATGGRVERGHAGIEAGLTTVVPTADAAGDPLFTALPADGFPGPQGHSDAVSVLPPGAVLVATGDVYPHQAFRLGRAAWGLQYHPEVTLEDFDTWMRGDPAVIAAGLDPAHVIAQVRWAAGQLDALAAAHARAFLGVVTSAGVPR